MLHCFSRLINWLKSVPIYGICSYMYNYMLNLPEQTIITPLQDSQLDTPLSTVEYPQDSDYILTPIDIKCTNAHEKVDEMCTEARETLKQLMEPEELGLWERAVDDKRSSFEELVLSVFETISQVNCSICVKRAICTRGRPREQRAMRQDTFPASQRTDKIAFMTKCIN